MSIAPQLTLPGNGFPSPYPLSARTSTPPTVAHSPIDTNPYVHSTGTGTPLTAPHSSMNTRPNTPIGSEQTYEEIEYDDVEGQEFTPSSDSSIVKIHEWLKENYEETIFQSDYAKWCTAVQELPVDHPIFKGKTLSPIARNTLFLVGQTPLRLLKCIYRIIEASSKFQEGKYVEGMESTFSSIKNGVISVPLIGPLFLKALQDGYYEAITPHRAHGPEDKAFKAFIGKQD